MQRARAMAHSCPAPAPDHKRSGTQVVAMPSKDHGRQAGLPKSSTTAAAGIPAKGQRTGRKIGWKRSRGVRGRSSRRRKGRQRRQSTSINGRHAGVHRARRCESRAWQKRHMQRSTLIILSRRSKQRSVSRASERSVRGAAGCVGTDFHRASRHPVRLASLVKNRQSKEHEENRSESPFSRWRGLAQVRTWSGPGKRQ